MEPTHHHDHICEHDFQPTLRGWSCSHSSIIDVWCLKCHLHLEVDRFNLDVLSPIAERVRDPQMIQ